MLTLASRRRKARCTNKQTIKRLSHVGKGIKRINDVTQFFDCYQLVSLNLHANSLDSIEALAELTALVDLNLSGNKLTSLQRFPQLQYLESLNLASNSLVSVNGLPALPALKSLNVAYNQLQTSHGLENLSGGVLWILDIRGNLFESSQSLDSLVQLTSLRELKFGSQSGVSFKDEKGSFQELVEWIVESLPQLKLLDGQRPSDVCRQVQALHPNRSKYDETRTMIPTHELVQTTYATPLVEAKQTALQTVALGYPVYSPDECHAARAASKATISVVSKVEEDQLASPSHIVLTEDKAVEVSPEEFAPRTAVAAVQVDLNISELTELRKSVDVLKKQLETKEEELSCNFENQQKLHKEFLLKIKALKQLSANNLRQALDKEVTHHRSVIRIAEEETEALRQELRKVVNETHQLAMQYKNLKLELQQEKTSKEQLQSEKQAMDQDRTRYAESHTLTLERLRQERSDHVAQLESLISSLKNKIEDKDKTIQECETKLKRMVDTVESLQNNSASEQDAKRNEISKLQNQLTSLENQNNMLKQEEQNLKKELSELQEMQTEEREAHKTELGRREEFFAEKLLQESTKSYREGEEKGKEEMKKGMESDSEKLKNSLNIVEKKFKDALRESETEKSNISKSLRAEANKTIELKEALRFSMVRSQKQDVVLKDLRAVIQAQQNSIKEFDNQAKALTDKLSLADLKQVETLESELASAKRMLSECEGLKAETMQLRKQLCDKESELKAFQQESEAFQIEVQRDFRSFEEELRKLRRDKNEASNLVESLKDKVQELEDTVQIKTTMLDSANTTIVDVKEERRELQNEFNDLKHSLDQADRQLNRATHENEALRKSLKNEQEEKEEMLTNFEKLLCDEKEVSDSLRRKLTRLEGEFEEKTKLITFADKEIAKCKEKYEEKLQSFQAERDQAIAELAAQKKREEETKEAESGLQEQLKELQVARQVETEKLEKLQVLHIRAVKENKALRLRLTEVESDMKRLLASVDRERTHSRTKMDQLEKIIVELRTPFT